MTTPEGHEPDLEALLDYLKRTRGFDFGAYKRTSLTRRVRNRMEALGIEDFHGYTDHLEVHPDEFVHLFNNILINVTGFFRDGTAWEYLRTAIIPRVLEARRSPEPVRIWSAGCASGEEAYTLAMLLAEALGQPAFRARVKIYATDANEAALNKGRQASYGVKDVEDVPPDLVAKYFRPSGNTYVVDADLRRAVVFGRHDLLHDSPISRIDLLACRNTLMYFNAEAQSRILERFAYALNPEGFLFVGKAEMLLASTDLFHPIDMKHRVFAKLRGAPPPAPSRSGSRPLGPTPMSASAIPDTAMASSGIAQILLDARGAIVMINDEARRLFALGPADIGRPLHELTVSYRPVELRSLIDDACAERRVVTVADVEFDDGDGRARSFDASVAPLLGAGGRLVGLGVTFIDVTQREALREELRRSNQDRETAHEELQTTNEELQSIIEELETTNEEFQSTNKDLETMNEELQSTNDELRSTNDELRIRNDTIEELSTFW